MSAARQGTAWSKLYSYHYGWSLLSAAASAAASFLAALCIGHAHLAQYAPWSQDKLLAADVGGGGDGGSTCSRPIMMKCKSESHISGGGGGEGGRSFTSDTIRTYLTNDSRRLQQSQSSSQGCFVGAASSQSFNDSSSLVDLTKPISSDTMNDQESQETTIEMIAAPPPPPSHCSRHITPSKSSAFQNMRTQRLSDSPEYMNTDEFQLSKNDSLSMETSTLTRKPQKKIIRECSLQVAPHGDSSSSNSKDIECSEEEAVQRSDSESHASPQRCGSQSYPSPPVISSVIIDGSSSSSPSSYSSKTLPRRIFSDLPRLPERNSFSTDSYSTQTDQDNDILPSSFTGVEPPDLFNTDKKVENVSYCNTMPYPGKRLTVYSNKGNVRAATISDDEINHLTHV